MFFSITYGGQIISLVSLALAGIRTLVRRRFIDKEKLADQKSRIKDIQADIKSAQKKKDLKSIHDKQVELTKVMGAQMGHTMKPMMVTYIPYIITIGWLRNTYATAGAVATLFGHAFGWLGWYIICSIITSSILNKILKA